MGFGKSLKKAFKKIGKVAKKIAPVALPLIGAGLAGPGGFMAGNAVGGLFSGASTATTADGFVGPPSPYDAASNSMDGGFFGNLWSGVKNVAGNIGNFFTTPRQSLGGQSLGGSLFENALELAPGIASGIFSMAGGQDANIANAKEAELNRAFQERMSSTAHQREIADLRSAGLNPILSGTGGMGSSTPGGSMASMSDVSTPAIHSGVSAYNAAQQRRMNNSLLAQQNAMTRKIIEETARVHDERSQIQAQTANLIAETPNIPLRGKQIGQDTSTAKQLERKLSAEADTQYYTRAKISQEIQNLTLMEKFLFHQGVNEELRGKILFEDTYVAKAAAAKARNNGDLDDSAYGRVLNFIERTGKSVSPFIPFTYAR